MYKIRYAIFLLPLLLSSPAVAQRPQQQKVAECVALADYEAAFNEIKAIGTETGIALRDYGQGRITKDALKRILTALQQRAFNLMWDLAESVPCDKQARRMAEYLFEEAQTAYVTLTDLLSQL